MSADPERSRRREAVGLIAWSLALVAMAWVLGALNGLRAPAPAPPAPADVAAPANWPLFGEAWTYIDQEFYGQHPAPETVAQGAVEGLVAALDDPYAVYLPAEAGQSAESAFLPHLLKSIGAWITPTRAGPLVLAVVPRSPAAAAGILPGDTLLGVGETPLAGLGPRRIEQTLDEEDPGPLRFVALARDGTTRAVPVRRSVVQEPGLAVRRPRPDIAVLRLPHLRPAVLAELDKILGDLAADRPSTLILDLRDSPGGDLDTLAAVAGRFLTGPVWIESGPAESTGGGIPHPAVPAGGEAMQLPVRLVVLVNEGTADTAEMLAGALHDGAGAVLVGQPTFGKGTVQSTRALTDASLLRLTTARWRTPRGTDVDGVGLTPDRKVPGADDQMATAMSVAAEPVTAGG